jgi:murein DD-endopeptidase MepM/ murein hydrolase activator NlpD
MFLDAGFLFGYPLPIPGILTSEIGLRNHPISEVQSFHSGIDIAADSGTPVLAAADGSVVTAGWMGGFGQVIILQYQGFRTLYGHF